MRKMRCLVGSDPSLARSAKDLMLLGVVDRRIALDDSTRSTFAPKKEEAEGFSASWANSFRLCCVRIVVDGEVIGVPSGRVRKNVSGGMRDLASLESVARAEPASAAASAASLPGSPIWLPVQETIVDDLAEERACIRL